MNETNDRLRQAVNAWQQALGHDHVHADPRILNDYALTTAPGTGNQPAAVLLPENTEQVQQLVRIAAQYQIPLYPISRGKNWGYGDATAPTPGQVIVDLKRMNRVIEVNSQLAYAVIEPGITQKQLYDHLQAHHPDLWMDCTGAGLEASVVGNTLDRGFGHTRLGDHVMNTCGMQVVLASGEILETGFGHYPNAQAKHVYRYGAGPFLDGLFCQSNFAIVTRIGLWLMPRPEAFCAFLFQTHNDHDLPDLIDRLEPLRLQGIIQSALHIANDLRVFSSRTRYPWDLTAGQTPLPDSVRAQLRHHFGVGAWNGLGAIQGTAAQVRAARQAIRRALRGYRLLFVTDRRLSLARKLYHALRQFGLGKTLGEKLHLLEPLYGLLKGIPTDEPLAGTGWRVRDSGPPQPVDPLQANAGLIWVSPVIPSTGSDARRLIALIEPIYLKHGFEMLTTFTMINERSMIAITNLAFDKRNAAECAQAEKCYEELMSHLLSHGYIPYRTGHRGYAKINAGPSVFWDVVRQIKQTLDPADIMSPGRYTP